MTDKPTPSKQQDLGNPAAKPSGQPSAEREESALESLGKAVVEPVLGADRTTTADRVREKLEREERGSSRGE